MKRALSSLSGIILFIAILVGFSGTYIVDEREQIVVTRFNKPVRVIVGEREPEEFTQLKSEISARPDSPKGLRIDMGAGLKFKMPFIDTVERFPDTLLEYDAEPERTVTRDKKVLIIDNFARWRIEDPLLYRIRVGSEMSARAKLDDIIYAVMREELGRNNLIEVIRTTNDNMETVEAAALASGELPDLAPSMGLRIEQGREKVMESVLKLANDRVVDQYGIRIVDVRIKRADLVVENLQAVFKRMEAERERVSKRYESEGEKEGAIIQSETDKRVVVLLANAQREAQELRGDADAQVVKIYADAFESNPELYKYIRSLEVIKESTPTGAEMVLGIESSLYKILSEGL